MSVYQFEPGMFFTKTTSLIGRHYNRSPVLPYAPDVLKATRDPLLTRKGLLIYGEMLRDDMVDLGLSLLSSVLVPTIRIVPGQDTHEGKWIADMISRQIEAIPGGAVRKLHKVMLAFMFGFSMTEQCFGLITEGDDIGTVALKDLKYRQPYFFDFITDKETGELCEVIQIDTGGSQKTTVPREKLIHFVVNDHIDPFRGSSIYRSSYPFWWAKQAFIKLRNIQAERKAGKLAIKHEDPNLLTPDQYDTIAEAIGEGYQNSDMFKVGPGMSVTVIQGEADPQTYTDLITSCDRVLLRPTKIPWLLVQEGIETGSYALAEVQERVMFGGHDAARGELESILNEPYGPIWWIMKLNGWSMADAPRLVLSNAIEKDRVKRIELYNTSAQAGTLKPEPQDQNWLRAGIGLEEIEEEETKKQIFTEQIPQIPRSLTPSEKRVNFAQIEASLDKQIEQSRQDLSRAWSSAIGKAQLEVTQWVQSNPNATPKDILGHIQGLELDLELFTSKLENGAKRAFLSGQKDAKQELGGRIT